MYDYKEDYPQVSVHDDAGFVLVTWPCFICVFNSNFAFDTGVNGLSDNVMVEVVWFMKFMISFYAYIQSN